MTDTPKRGPGQPRKDNAKITRTLRASPATIAAKEASGKTWEELVLVGLATLAD